MTEDLVIAIEGKILKGTYKKDKRCDAIHIVSAFSDGWSIEEQMHWL
ncbi:hypothetical protein [Vibrio splendidus]|nr:hypothetical protein [Vibrio splendidus]